MCNSVIRACSVLSILVMATAHGADWPQFRGPGGQGISTVKDLPITWSDNENLVWKTPLPGSGASSPIAVGDKLYLTCYSGYGMGQSGKDISQLMRHVLCVDLKSGEILWDTKVPPQPPEQPKVRDHGYAASTLASDGKHLYAFLGKCGVLKFDLKGKKIWQADVGSGVHAWGTGTSPVLYKNLVIVNASVECKSLVAIDKTSGKEVWRAKGMNLSWNTPHLVDVKGKQEVVVSVKDRVLAFDPDKGKELWRCRAVPDYVCPSIVSKDGIIYVIGGRKSKAFAIRAGGHGDVSGSHIVWEAEVGANVPSPVIHDGYLYWASDRSRHAYCLSLKDGSIKYDQPIPGQPYASVLCAAGKLYIVTRRKGTFVLPAKPSFEILASDQLSDRAQFNASPIVAGSNLILRSDSTLYCIGEK